MSTPGTILTIDDDNFCQKIVAKSLKDEPYTLHFADNGQEGLERARELKPDAIILDVEMPLMNGYEVCEQLRQDENIKDTPVIFLSSHASLRDRMQGYQAGGDDYLVKPFDYDDLVVKIKVLARYHEEQDELKRQFTEAKQKAINAREGIGELGMAMQFVEESYSYYNYELLADSLLDVCHELGLICAIMILEEEGPQWFSANEAIRPLEKEMMMMVERDQRFIDFDARMIVNFQNLSLLVKNMPLDDRERYTRVKDLLPVLMSAVDTKINTIKAEKAMTTQSDEVIESFGEIRGSLLDLVKILADNQEKSTVSLKEMVQSLNTDLLSMGLEEDQEAYLLNRIDSAIESAAEQLDSTHILHSVFSEVVEKLKAISAKQRQLQELFYEMNHVRIKHDQEDDDSIELF